MDLCKMKDIKLLMSEFDIFAKKKFGQNFLINRSIVEIIAGNCCGNPDGAAGSPETSSACVILEIGPGMGVLTRELALRYSRVVAVELDKSLKPVLERTLDGLDNIDLMFGDIMETDLRPLLEPYAAASGSRVSVCANLPYYITTPVIMKLLETARPFDDITVMVQAEVAARLLAAPGTPNYGSITAAVNYYGKVRRLLAVSSGNFYPEPKVDSAVIKITPHQIPPHNPADEQLMFRVIKAAFGQRRKTLANALTHAFPEIRRDSFQQIITRLGHNPNIRGEVLGINEFCELSDEIKKL